MKKTLSLPLALGLSALFSFAVVHAGIFWKWSVFMDDIFYVRDMPRISGLWSEFADEVQLYWHQGRFYPFKYLANIVKWLVLPHDPNAFHAFGAALLVAALFAGARAVTRERAWIVFIVGLGLAQRPLLDIGAINTLAEGWVVLFFGLGLALFPQGPVAYRLLLLLSGLSKEPAILAFAATGAAQLVCLRARRQALIDFAIFAALAVLMFKAKQAGSYMADYSLVSVHTLARFLIGLVKVGLGLLPAAAAALLVGRLKLPRRLAPGDARVVACVLFGLGYLYLACARDTAGYLLIPAGFALTLAAGVAIERLEPKLSGRPGAPALVALVFAVVLASSLWRYERYARGINETTYAVEELLLTRQPRLVLIDGMEAASQARELAEYAGTHVMVRETSSQSPALIRDFLRQHPEGDVALVDATSYFGPLEEKDIEEMGAALGGWRQRLDRGVYRLFYGLKPANSTR